MSASFRIETLAGQDRSLFSCGVAELDEYLKTRASQDVRRRSAGCFLTIENTSETIAGFYTLSACHVLLRDLDPAISKKLPRYPEIPAVRLGRLAVDRNYHGQKLGAGLLADAVRRSLGLDIGANLMIVDAKDETAAAFYRHHGFVALDDKPLQLVASLLSLA